MSVTISRTGYHADAERFIFAALDYTQRHLGRNSSADDDVAHISGPELLRGIRELAIQQWGLMAATVFAQWGVRSTEDFGRIVFDLVERGEMRKTDEDELEDFLDVYDFADAFDREVSIDTRQAFVSQGKA